jgi:hypothetical protein
MSEQGDLAGVSPNQQDTAVDEFMWTASCLAPSSEPLPGER